MNRTELRKLSLEFRRVSSNFLNSTMDNADVNLSRFLKFVNGTPLIKGFIETEIKGVEYDFRKCYGFESDDWAEYTPPEDEACHIKAQYDYLIYINESENACVQGHAMQYCWADKKINAIIQDFLSMAFKPLIDFINDRISMEMIVLDEEEKSMRGTTFIQNIETLNGPANQQASGTINNYASAGDTGMMLELIDKLMLALKDANSADESVEDVRDDLEMIKEQLQSEAPKKSRLQKALNGIKNFVGQMPAGITASLIATAITTTDWTALIQQIELFIGKMG